MPKNAILQRMKKFNLRAPDQLHISSFLFVRNKQKKILLEKVAKDFEGSAAGKWIIPGVILKFGEHADEAAKRIFTEELEIPLRPLRLHQIQSHLDHGDHWDLIFIYECDPIAASRLAKPAKGIEKLEYHDPRRLPKPLGYGLKDLLVAEKIRGKTFI